VEDLLSPRADGRGAEDLRPVRITRGFQEVAEGSCLIEVGKTRVVCSASWEGRVPPFLRGTGRGWVTGEYSMLPRSTVVRTPREVQAGRPSGRTQEIQRLIGRSLRAVCDLAAMGESMVTVDCDVLLADGGTRTAAITGGWIALRDALAAVHARGDIERMPPLEEVAAVSVGLVAGGPMLDLCYEEDSLAEVDMNVVMTGSGRLVEVQGTAEGEPFVRKQLDEMLDLATAGIETLVRAQRAALSSG
jgi:ribonuclease PH